MKSLATEIRAGFRLARVTLHLFWGVTIVALAFGWLPLSTKRYLRTRWSRQLLAMLGVRHSVAGPIPSGGLMVANHISWLDIFAINALVPATFLSKDDVLEWPIIGWLAKQVGTLFLERGSRSAAQHAKQRVVAELERGQLIGIFPEGTTGYGHCVMPFHAALFQAAIDAKVPVIPAVVRYTDRIGLPSIMAAYVGETTLMQCLHNIAKASGLIVHLEIQSALESTGKDRRHLAHTSHQAIAHRLAALTPSHWVPPAANTATGIPADPPSALPSNTPPKDSQNQAPTGQLSA